MNELIQYLSTNYVLGNLNISMPASNSRLKAQATDLARQKNARQRNVSVSAVNIYENSELISSLFSLLRGWRREFTAQTDPWSARGAEGGRATGDRLILTTQVEKIMDQYALVQSQYHAIFRRLSPEAYETEIDYAKNALGDLAEQVKWLPYSDFVTKFHLDFFTSPIPSYSENIALPSDIAKKFMHDQTERTTKIARFAFTDRLNRLTEAVETLSKALQPGGRIYDPTYNKPKELSGVEFVSLARIVSTSASETPMSESRAKYVASLINLTLSHDVEYVRANPPARRDAREGLQRVRELLAQLAA